MSDDNLGIIPPELKRELLLIFLTAVEKCRSMGFHPCVSFMQGPGKPCMVILTEDTGLDFVPLSSVPPEIKR